MRQQQGAPERPLVEPTVGAVIAVSPVATLLVTWLSNRISPGFFPPDDLNAATIAGAFVVTVGSAMSARK